MSQPIPHIVVMGSRTGHTARTNKQPLFKGGRSSDAHPNATMVALVEYLARYAAERDDATSRKKRARPSRRKGADKDSHEGGA